MNPRRRRVAVFAAGLLVLAAVFHLGFVTWLAHAIIQAPNIRAGIAPPEGAGASGLAGLGIDAALRIPVGPPPASLSAWVLNARPGGTPARGTVLVLHGIRDRKESMLGMGRLLAEHGFEAVLVDLRGHGRSSGSWMTYGIVEARDLEQTVDELERRGWLQAGLGIYGASYGGAVALESAALDARVRAVVTVATFASAREAVVDYIRRTAPAWLLPSATIDQAFRRAGRLAGVDLAAARPVDAIRATRAACLLLHGTADRTLPPHHARELAAAGAGHDRLVLLEGAGHESIFADRSGTIARETIAWFEKHLAGGQDP